MHVAIRELKASLSRVLARARAGEVIEVTSHDRPIARIVGIPDEAADGLRRLVASGAAAWAGGKPMFDGAVGAPSVRHPGQSDGVGGPWLILFCDTSALIKLYLSEPESDALLAEAGAASAVAVCRIAWAAAFAAIARRAREVPADGPSWTKRIGACRPIGPLPRHRGDPAPG